MLTGKFVKLKIDPKLLAEVENAKQLYQEFSDKPFSKFVVHLIRTGLRTLSDEFYQSILEASEEENQDG